MLLEQSWWIKAALVLLVTLIGHLILRTLIGLLSRRLERWSGGSRGPFYGIAAQMLSRTSGVLLLVFSLMIGLKVVGLPPRWESSLAHGWFVVLAFQVALWCDCGIRLWVDRLLHEPGKVRNPVTTTLIGILLRLLAWTLMLLSVLANLGVDITALVASLGVGGIAIALAVQTLLSDVFASLSIGVDKPFELGDFIVFGEVAGSIEHIGLKTTRIRSLSGEQIVCSNAELLKQTLHNYKRMEQRRIVFKFGVTYNTPPQKVRQIGAVVAQIIQGIELTRFDRAHFATFDDYQLTFEVVYFVLSAEYNRYMDIQQEINLGLLERFAEMQVQFAFPTQSLEFIGGTLPQISVAGLAHVPAANGSNPPIQGRPAQ
ncbi:MAG: mechanosensitive ion channel family protein [Pseudomonas sp.]|uniref:mechanosensitive ion channel family protein n=1 Tax=Pseudomonas sp. TaxID=306 RepID=UPI0033991935